MSSLLRGAEGVFLFELQPQDWRRCSISREAGVTARPPRPVQQISRGMRLPTSRMASMTWSRGTRCW